MAPINANVLHGSKAYVAKEVLPEVETENGNEHGYVFCYKLKYLLMILNFIRKKSY